MKIFLQFFVLIFLFPVTNFGQEMKFNYQPEKIRKDIQKLVKKIEKYDRIDSEAIGYSGERTNQYNRFEKLTEKAFLEELIELTNHPNAAVRGYSFWSLAKLHYNNLEEIFVKHANDEEFVFMMDGCIPEELPVIEFMRQVAMPDVLDNQCKKLSDEVFVKMNSKRVRLRKN